MASSRRISIPTARGAEITKSWCAGRLPTSGCATKWFPTSKADSPATCPAAPRCRSLRRPKNTLPTGVPLVILAGKEYGSGSSRDWAAKGPLLLGVRAVIAESYERIHRSNLVGMGILPLQFLPGETAESLGLTGEEVFEITGIRELVENFASGQRVKVRAGQENIRSRGANRYAARGALLRQRRDFAVCAAAVGGGKAAAGGRIRFVTGRRTKGEIIGSGELDFFVLMRSNLEQVGMRRSSLRRTGFYSPPGQPSRGSLRQPLFN